jgi:hypothetical protein
LPRSADTGHDQETAYQFFSFCLTPIITAVELPLSRRHVRLGHHSSVVDVVISRFAATGFIVFPKN